MAVLPLLRRARVGSLLHCEGQESHCVGLLFKTKCVNEKLLCELGGTLHQQVIIDNHGDATL